jgi:hypothetical protein
MLAQAARFGLKHDRFNEQGKDGVSAYWFSPEKLPGGGSVRYIWLSADRHSIGFVFCGRNNNSHGPIYTIRNWSRERSGILNAMRDWLKPEIAA